MLLTLLLLRGKLPAMQKLLQFFNSLDVDGRADFLLCAQTSEGYIRKACSVGQALGPALCSAIERASGGAVTRQDLRPHDWQDIWPELQSPPQRLPPAAVSSADV